MRFLFDQFQLDADTFELTASGDRVRIEPKALNLLHHLLRNPDRVVTKEELLEAVWPDETVTDAALAYSVKEARRALRSVSQTEILKTVPRRGYRLAVDVETDGPATGGSEASETERPAERRVDASGPSPARVPDAGFVGRTSEMERLRAGFENARQRQARLFLVSGDAGIGKTRLTREFGSEAVERGALLLTGHCHETMPPAFWPWAQIIQEYARRATEADLLAAVGTGAADLAQMLPSLADRLDDATPPPLDTDQARLRLLDSLTRFVANVAERQPLVLVLEDLHWADPSTVLVLRSVVDALPAESLLVLGTYRDSEVEGSHPLQAALGPLRRDGRVEEIPLTGLSNEEAEDLLAYVAETAPSRAVSERIVEVAAGNPFFLTELHRHLRDEGLLHATDRPLPELSVPRAVRDLLDRRLERLRPPTRKLLVAASGCGTRFSYDLLSSVGPADEDAVLDALEEAEQAGLVHEADDAPGAYRFAHALVRDAFYQSIGAARRARLHEQLATALEARHGDTDGPHLADLARHTVLAIPRIGAERAFGATVRAGRWAAAQLACDDATDQFERALAIEDAAISDADRCATLLDLAAAAFQAGRGERSREAYWDAAALARKLGDPLALARAALGLTVRFEFGDERTIPLLEDALAMNAADDPVPDPGLVARLESGLASALYLVPGSRARREELCANALQRARETGEDAVLARVQNAWSWALWESDNLSERLQTATELVEAATRAHDAEMILRGRTWRLVDLLELGQIAEFDAELARLWSDAEEVRFPLFRWNARSYSALRAFLDGKLEKSEELCTEGFEIGRRFNEQSAFVGYFGQLFSIRRQQGRLDEIEPGISSLAEQSSHMSWTWLLAYVYAELDRHDDAARTWKTITANEFRDLPQGNAHNTRLNSIASLATVCTYLGDVAGSEALTEMLEPHADQWIVSGHAVGTQGSVAHYLGMLARARKDWKVAIEQCEKALESHSQPGTSLLAFKTLLEMGRSLRGAKMTSRAKTVLADARALAEAAGNEYQLRQVDEALG